MRLGRRRSDELYATFSAFLQDDVNKGLYANDTVGSLSLHGALQRPCPPWSAAEFMRAEGMAGHLRNAGMAAVP